MVEISKRLVKVAKTAMILNGDGHAGFTQGDSLGDFKDLDPIILSKARPGMPKVMLTNPPWAGTEKGRITDDKVLDRFDLGKVWKWNKNNYKKTNEILKEGVPPELLFFERCIQWLAPGGKLGIVLPKGFLDTDTALPARHILFKNCRLLAVVNCHKNTFQPHTGPRPCLILLEKLRKSVSINEIKNYKIFMAISRRIGQDSEGKPIYKIDEAGNITNEIDHDLDQILDQYKKFCNKKIKETEYAFAVNFGDIDKNNLRINPQAFLPSLNLTIKKLLGIDERPDWSVMELSQVSPTIRIFKPPRLKSENLVIENPKDTSGLEQYYTPSTLLQNKTESIKWFDLRRANATQLKTISILRLKKDEILITRSGSIGRIIYVTERFDGIIASDDLIRVCIPNDEIRYYIYHFLRSKAGQDQMIRNEYGSIQQHLEATHIKQILIPIPDNKKILKQLIKNAQSSFSLLEKSFQIDKEAVSEMVTFLSDFGITEKV
jgi:type I restriction-modification system DNA methylase subunit